MKNTIKLSAILVLVIISFSVLATGVLYAGFDPVPKQYQRHPVSQDDFGRPNIAVEEETTTSGDKPNLAQELESEIVPPLKTVSNLVNQPAYISRIMENDIDASMIASWNVTEIKGKTVRVAPVIVADKGFELNLDELTVKFEGEGTLEAGIVYNYKDDFQQAIEKNIFTGFRRVASDKANRFYNRYKGAKYAWIVLSAQGKIKLTGLKHSCNIVKGGQYGHIPREYRFEHGSLLYRIMYPKNYDPSKKYPLVISVHGSGGVGSDNSKNMEMTILARYLYISYYDDPEFECFSIVPQIPDDKSIPAPYYPNGSKGVYSRTYHPAISLSTVNATGWYTKATLSLVHEMLNSPELSIDPSRVYYSGFSYGGKACWEFLKADPDLFAGAICCAGWPIGMPYKAPNEVQFERLKSEVTGYKKVPVYITAGEKDGMRLGSKVVYDEIIRQGGKSIYKEIKNADHVQSSTKTWSDKGIVEWLFDQKKTFDNN